MYFSVLLGPVVQQPVIGTGYCLSSDGFLMEKASDKKFIKYNHFCRHYPTKVEISIQKGTSKRLISNSPVYLLLPPEHLLLPPEHL